MKNGCLNEDVLFYYAIKELAQKETTAVEEHTKDCDDCKTTVSDYREIFDVLNIPLQKTPPRLLEWALKLPHTQPALFTAQKTGHAEVRNNFVFASASEDAPLFIKYRKDEHDSWNISALTENKILPRFVYEIETNGDAFKKIKPAQRGGNVLVIIDKRVYTADEEVNLLLYSTSYQHQTVKINIKNNNTLFYYEEIPLAPQKVIHKRIGNLEEGSYVVALESDETLQDAGQFTVAPYTLSSLEARIVDTFIDENNKLTATLTLQKMGVPYDGIIHLGLNCEHCQNNIPMADVVDEKIPVKMPYASFRDIIDEVNLTEKEINDYLTTVEYASLARQQQTNIVNLIKTLRRVDHKTEVSIIEGLYQKDPELARKITDEVFSFSAVPLMADKDIQDALMKIQSNQILAIAVSNQPKPVADALLRNVSERRQALIKQELVDFSKQKIKFTPAQIHRAQKEIIDTIKAIIHIKRGTAITVDYEIQKKLKRNVNYERAKVVDGQVVVKLPIALHKGTFTLEISTKEGDTASVFIPKLKRTRVKAEAISNDLPLSELSYCNKFTVIQSTDSQKNVFALKSASRSMLQIECRKNVQNACIVTKSKNSAETEIIEYKDIRDGDILYIPATGATQSLFFGAETPENDFIEEDLTITIPAQLPDPIALPEKAQPGADLALFENVRHTSEFVLIVKDIRLGKDQLTAFHEQEEEHLTESFRQKEMRLSPEKLPVRKDFKDVAFCGVVNPYTATDTKVQLGHQIARWRATLYGFKDEQLYYEERIINAIPDFFVELDTPVLMSDGDEVQCKAHYRTPVEATLTLKGEEGELLKQTISPGTGVATFTLTKPQTLYAEFKNHAYGDKTEKEIKHAAKTRVTFTRARILKSGDILESESGDIIHVYPTPLNFMEKSVEALLNYPFGCAEQTASKLYGLAILYSLAQKGQLEQDAHSLEGQIETGLSRLRLFNKNDLFSLWENAETDLQLTKEIMLRLIPFRELHFKLAHEVLERTCARLCREGIKDNLLVRLNTDFQVREKKFGLSSKIVLSSVREAAEVYGANLSDRDKKESYRFVKEAAKVNGNVYWTDSRAMAGTAEASAHALKVLFQEKDELFYKGFASLCEDMQDFMLYTTSDTAAFVDLLNTVGLKDAAQVRYEGVEKTLKGEALTWKIEVLAGQCVALMKEVKEINPLDVRSNLNFNVAMSGTQLYPGEKLKIKMDALEKTYCPVAKVLLPGTLAFLRDGANLQSLHLPLKNDTLFLEATAIRRGTGKLFVLMYDMYRKEKIAVKEMEIKIG